MSRDIWIYDADLRKELDLTCMQCLFLGIIQQTQSKNCGYCNKGNAFFSDKLDAKGALVSSTLKKFQEMGIIWVHSKFAISFYNKSRERHIVTRKSELTYAKFLIRMNRPDVLKKFREEFFFS